MPQGQPGESSPCVGWVGLDFLLGSGWIEKRGRWKFLSILDVGNFWLKLYAFYD